ncbi:MAG TPA: hypothetical protein VG452_00545 [Egibacteraceae bacterium]|nr:hypothetical protein [Egibacteraceae bacterium]
MASSTDTQRFQGREHFPPDTVKWEHLVNSARTRWRWREGTACLLRLAVDDAVLAHLFGGHDGDVHGSTPMLGIAQRPTQPRQYLGPITDGGRRRDQRRCDPRRAA